MILGIAENHFEHKVVELLPRSSDSAPAREHADPRRIRLRMPTYTYPSSNPHTPPPLLLVGDHPENS